jgi:two-component sensor histidine kinase
MDSASARSREEPGKKPLAGDTFAIGWTERGGPTVSAPKRRGFGTAVIAAMTERSVDGAVDLDYGPLGVARRLTCPVANALGARWNLMQMSNI